VAEGKGTDVGEVLDLVKVYVKQETVGPLRGLGRKIGLGLAGAFALALGVFFLAFGVLRLVQDQVPRLARGNWSWASYAIAFAFCVIVAVVAASRIGKTDKELP
jgi:hypothetical protein